MVDNISTYCLSRSGQNIRITSFQNGQNTNSEQFTNSGTQFVVTTLEVVNFGFTQHSVVFQFRFSQNWGVGSNDDQFGRTLSQGFDSGFVTQSVFTRFNN